MIGLRPPREGKFPEGDWVEMAWTLGQKHSCAWQGPCVPFTDKDSETQIRQSPLEAP